MINSIINWFANKKLSIQKYHGMLKTDRSYRRGHYNDALRLNNHINNICKDQGDKFSSAICDQMEGKIYSSLGQYDKALKLLESAKKIFIDYNFSYSLAATEMILSSVYLKLERFEEAIELNESALEIFRNLKMENEIAACELGLGTIYSNLGQFEKAAALIESSGEVFYNQISGAENVAICDFQMAVISYHRGEYIEALNLYQKAKTVFQKKGLLEKAIDCDLNAASIYILLEKYDAALNLLHLSRDRYDELGNPEGIAKCDDDIATIYMLLEQYEQSLEFFKKSLNSDHPQIRSKSLLGIGLVHEKMGSNKKARKAYEDAIYLIEDRWHSISNDDVRTSYLTTKFDFYYVLISMCIKQEDFESALYFVEKLKSRNLIELISEKVFVVPDTENVVQDVSDVLDNSSLLVELFPMDDKIVLFLISKKAHNNITTIILNDINRFILFNDIEDVAKSYSDYQYSEQSEKHKKRVEWEYRLDELLKALYQRIFRRIEPHLNGIEKIIFVPHALLHLVPLHAMFYEAEDGTRKYVIDEYQVTYAPSAKLYKLCSGRKYNRKDNIIVSHADPNKTSDTLFFAQMEVNKLKSIFPDCHIIPKTTKIDLINQSKYAHIFHYAGHANYQAFILHDENHEEKQAEFDVKDIFAYLDMRDAYLATLSACDTGLMISGMIDECIGISTGLLHAGAETVISSLWSVSDIASSLIMTQMYTLISQGYGKAEALRKSQLWLKDSCNRSEQEQLYSSFMANNEKPSHNFNAERFRPDSDGSNFIQEDFSKPFYWAGFICTGAE